MSGWWRARRGGTGIAPQFAAAACGEREAIEHVATMPLRRAIDEMEAL